ncbi:p25-alpha domain-containing protein [Phthorimaea operculella]|nr:p25-alpha domain-containing protein [Phthorimaea operculella]
MGESEGPTLESQFKEFAKKMDTDRDGTTINLSNSDFWLRQSKILEDRELTMTDTGKMFFEKFSTRTEINFEEWVTYLEGLCASKNMDVEQVKMRLTTCGLPGEASADPPNYRDHFDKHKPKAQTS